MVFDRVQVEKNFYGRPGDGRLFMEAIPISMQVLAFHWEQSVDPKSSFYTPYPTRMQGAPAPCSQGQGIEIN